MPPPLSTRRAPRLHGLLTWLLLWTVAGCGGEASPESVPIDRETFIQSWVDLRAEAIASGEPLSDSLRASVLQRHQVTEEELLGFAEVQGDDLAYMRELWIEVEERLRAREIPAGDSVRLY